MPTRKSLDEAAQLAGRGGWGSGDFGSLRLKKSIEAHALTLDQLHGRVEMSESEQLYRELGRAGEWLVDGYTLGASDQAAIKLLEKALAGAATASDMDGDWIEWDGSSPDHPVRCDSLIEIKFRNGVVRSESLPSYWCWEWCDCDYDIVAYRLEK